MRIVDQTHKNCFSSRHHMSWRNR